MKYSLAVLVLSLAACNPVAQTPIHEREIVDLTWTLDENSIAWPTSSTFELETRDGRIRLMAEDVSNLQQNKRRTTGQLGSGEGTIYVRTDDGSVTLRQ